MLCDDLYVVVQVANSVLAYSVFELLVCIHRANIATEA